MADNYNIEDIFKDNFHNQKVSPSGHIWDNIESDLKAETQFGKQFDNYKVKPSEQIWYNIQRKLAFADFFRLNLSRFNVYYAVLSAFIITGSVLFVLNENKNVGTNNQISGIEKSDKEIRQIKIINKEEKTQIAFANINTNNSDNIQVQQAQTIQELQFKDAELINLIATEEKVPNIESKEEFIEQSNSFTDNADDESIKKDDIVKNQLTNNIVAVNEINTEDEKSVSLVNYNEESIIKHEMVNQPEYIVSKPCDLIELDDMDKVFLNMYDDTVGIDAFGNDIVWERTKWYIDVYLSPSFSSVNWESKYPENSLYSVKLNDNSSSQFSYSYGLNVNYQYKKFFFQTGLSYNKTGYNYNYSTSSLNIDSVQQVDYHHSGYYVNDTVSYIDLDALIQGDTVYNQEIIRRWIETVDTSYSMTTDTTTKYSQFVSKNVYEYIELPLMFGYKLEYNKLSFIPKAGLIAGLNIKNQGKLHYYKGNQIVDIEKLHLPEVIPVMSVVFGCDIDYKISEKFSAFLNPYYRQNITSIYKSSSPVYAKINSYGLRTGLRFEF